MGQPAKRRAENDSEDELERKVEEGKQAKLRLEQRRQDKQTKLKLLKEERAKVVNDGDALKSLLETERAVLVRRKTDLKRDQAWRDSREARLNDVLQDEKKANEDVVANHQATLNAQRKENRSVTHARSKTIERVKVENAFKEAKAIVEATVNHIQEKQCRSDEIQHDLETSRARLNEIDAELKELTKI